MKKFHKENLIGATYRFRQELKDLGLPETEVALYLREFAEWFKRSFDYDMAAERVFDRVMSSVKSQNSFRAFWKGENIHNMDEKAEEVAASSEGGSGLLMRIVKVLMAEFGITFAAALVIAHKNLHKK